MGCNPRKQTIHGVEWHLALNEYKCDEIISMEFGL